MPGSLCLKKKKKTTKAANHKGVCDACIEIYICKDMYCIHSCSSAMLILCKNGLQKTPPPFFFLCKMPSLSLCYYLSVGCRRNALQVNMRQYIRIYILMHIVWRHEKYAELQCHFSALDNVWEGTKQTVGAVY